MRVAGKTHKCALRSVGVFGVFPPGELRGRLSGPCLEMKDQRLGRLLAQLRRCLKRL